MPLFRLPSAPLLSRSQNLGAEIKRAKTRMRLESEAVELKKCVKKCDKIFGKKEDNFHFPIRARYAS